MLIYNYKKEFLGIDGADLEALGLSNLADLRNEAADFADLFVKTPGHIHNFKHVHWIDYILCEEGISGSKVIINIKDKNYSATIDIKTMYLVDNPTERAYLINLSQIRVLSRAQNERIAADVLVKPAPKSTTEVTELITTPGSIVHDENAKKEHEEEVTEVAFDPYESSTPDIESNTVPDMYEVPNEQIDLSLDAPLEVDFEDESFEEDNITETQESVEQIATPKKAPKVEEYEGEYAGYVYNPEVASEELGLPIDLIEEFIQDFIAQANSFKDELYQSTASEDANQLKIQSHKLKGVAANLRIEDALAALTVINTSDNYDEIKNKLDDLYKIIAKLSNKSNAGVTQEVEVNTPNEEEDDFVLSFKEDVVLEASETKKSIEDPALDSFANDVIVDADVPNTIAVPELADDDFLKTDAADEEIEDEDLSILDEPYNEDETTTEKDVLDIALNYDRQRIAEDIGLDIDSFNELFEDYLHESHELSSTIINSVENNNLEACKSSAIKLKGMSDNMRIHKFDDELDSIINSTDITNVKGFLDSVTSKLDSISKTEDK